VNVEVGLHGPCTTLSAQQPGDTVIWDPQYPCGRHRDHQSSQKHPEDQVPDGKRGV